jgi:cytochrome c
MLVRSTVILATAAILTACSQPAAPPSAPSGAASTESAAPVALTVAQTKALVATLPADYQNADLANGQAKFAICKACHNTAKGAGDMTGPNLYGVFGRKAGSETGFAYSDGMKALNVTWDADSINKWISNPKAMIPATKMTYIGMDNPKDRIDVIAYLKTVTSDAPAG